MLGRGLINRAVATFIAAGAGFVAMVALGATVYYLLALVVVPLAATERAEEWNAADDAPPSAIRPTDYGDAIDLCRGWRGAEIRSSGLWSRSWCGQYSFSK